MKCPRYSLILFSMQNRLELTKHVQTIDCTKNRTLRLLTLMNWLQEAADAHATQLGVGIEYCTNHNMTWVGRSYHIIVEKFPKLHDKVKVSTWPSERNKLTATREFLIQDPSEDSIVLFKATSSWIMIDIEKRKILPLETHTPQYELDETRVIPTNFPKITDLQDVKAERTTHHIVRYDEIDLNQHVNNANYLLWAAEEINQNGNAPHAIQIDFKKEGKEDTDITIKSTVNENESLHIILGKDPDDTEEKELCRVKILWDRKALFKK